MLQPVKCEKCGLSCDVEQDGDHYGWVCNNCHTSFQMSDEDVDTLRSAAQKTEESGGTSANIESEPCRFELLHSGYKEDGWVYCGMCGVKL
jgi:Fe2+ or Zn2+ uptake regulation protein